MSDSEFPPIEFGASLILAWQIRRKRVLIIGGGVVAAGRLSAVLAADALVTLISPSSTLSPEVRHRIATYPHLIAYHDRVFDVERDITPETAPEYAMCLTAIDDPFVSTQIYKLCHEYRIPCNIADVPPECDFYFGSIHRDGPLQIMVSTNGNGPKIANLIRRRIENALPPNCGEAIMKVGELRRRLRKVATGTELGPKRMEWMIKVCEEWTLDELGEMGDEEMNRLLDNWAVWKDMGGTVPKRAEMMGLKEERSWTERLGAWAEKAGLDWLFY